MSRQTDYMIGRRPTWSFVSLYATLALAAGVSIIENLNAGEYLNLAQYFSSKKSNAIRLIEIEDNSPKYVLVGNPFKNQDQNSKLTNLVALAPKEKRKPSKIDPLAQKMHAISLFLL